MYGNTIVKYARSPPEWKFCFDQKIYYFRALILIFVYLYAEFELIFLTGLVEIGSKLFLLFLIFFDCFKQSEKYYKTW